MATVIEDSAFISKWIGSKSSNLLRDQGLQQGMKKIMKISDQSTCVLQNSSFVTFVTRHRTFKLDFMVKSQGSKVTQSIQTLIYLLKGSIFWHSLSQHTELLFMKEIIKKQKQLPPEVIICLDKGRALMMLNNFIIPKYPKFSKSYQFYRRTIVKNIMYFEQRLHNYLRSARQERMLQEQKPTQLHKILMYSNILNNVCTNNDISEERSQYNKAQNSFQKQSQQLATIQKNIVKNNLLENDIARLYLLVNDHIKSEYLKQSLINQYQKKSIKIKKLLNLRYPEQRRVEDYIYSTVKIQKCMNEGYFMTSGGTSNIYIYQMKLAFLSSTDHNFQATNIHKVEKFLVVKKPKIQQKDSQKKIIHEKMIVQQLKSSVSHFIPKYYDPVKDEGFNNCLMMQVIQGQQLGKFINSRQETLSLYSKLHQVMNIVYGLRHLINYGIVHLDLKPMNIIIQKNKYAKIIDFGEAYHSKVCPKNYKPGFTFPYVAPEVFANILSKGGQLNDTFKYTQKQDVFALGIVISEVLFNNRIFYLDKMKQQQIFFKKKHLSRVFCAFERNEYYGDDLLISTIFFLVIKCLDPDPKQRPLIEWIGITLKSILNTYVNSFI